jgi:myo-inositol-1-phosphate synthase
MGRIKIAIAGVGNCASSLVQGIEYYRGRSPEDAVGLMHWEIGDYRPCDIEVVTAFDIDVRKVGKDVSEAIFEPPNCTTAFCGDLPKTGVPVRMGRVLDGVAEHMRDHPEARSFLPSGEGEATREGVVLALRRSGAEVLLNYLPVGSERAARFYAECALEAGVALVNCIPVFIASDPAFAKRFEEKGLPIVGDDIKAQLGATITHRTLTDLFRKRGVKLEHTTAAASPRRRSRRPRPCSPWPQSGSPTTASTSAPATTWPGRTTTRCASCAWRGGSSGACP